MLHDTSWLHRVRCSGNRNRLDRSLESEGRRAVAGDKHPPACAALAITHSLTPKAQRMLPSAICAREEEEG